MILGIDPGVKACHVAVIEPLPTETVYGRRARLVTCTCGDVEHVLSLAGQLGRAQSGGAYLAAVEVARGAVRGDIDHDPVLENNIVAGQIIGGINVQAFALGYRAAPVASGGDATAWNWRSMIGVKGVSGAAARDELVRRIVGIRLENAGEIPTGPKGGLIHDYWDAAGIALGALDRMLQFPERRPWEAMSHRSNLELLAASGRQASKHASKLSRKYGGRAHGRST